MADLKSGAMVQVPLSMVLGAMPTLVVGMRNQRDRRVGVTNARCDASLAAACPRRAWAWHPQAKFRTKIVDAYTFGGRWAA